MLPRHCYTAGLLPMREGARMQAWKLRSWEAKKLGNHFIYGRLQILCLRGGASDEGHVVGVIVVLNRLQRRGPRASGASAELHQTSHEPRSSLLQQPLAQLQHQVP